jgi:hypothetical protein
MTVAFYLLPPAGNLGSAAVGRCQHLDRRHQVTNSQVPVSHRTGPCLLGIIIHESRGVSQRFKQIWHLLAPSGMTQGPNIECFLIWCTGLGAVLAGLVVAATTIYWSCCASQSNSLPSRPSCPCTDFPQKFCFISSACWARPFSARTLVASSSPSGGTNSLGQCSSKTLASPQHHFRDSSSHPKQWASFLRYKIK